MEKVDFNNNNNLPSTIDAMGQIVLGVNGSLMDYINYGNAKENFIAQKPKTDAFENSKKKDIYIASSAKKAIITALTLLSLIMAAFLLKSNKTKGLREILKTNLSKLNEKLKTSNQTVKEKLSQIGKNIKAKFNNIKFNNIKPD